MNKREFKDQVYGELAKVSKALANPYRLEIICLLAQREFTVEELANEVEVSVANVSQHLQTLKGAKLIKSTREGHFIKYSLTNKNVYRLWLSMSDLSLEMNAEIKKILSDFRSDKENLEAVTLNDLRKRNDLDQYIFLDVRPENEFKSGAMPGAVSIPIDELDQRLDELDKEKKVVAYCRGPFCLYADEAINVLKQHGFEAEKLERGFEEWSDSKNGIDG